MRQLISDLTIATRNLSRNLRRTAVSTLTVAGGIVAFAMASGFMAWVFEDMRDSTVRSQLGHVQIVRPHYFDKGIADPYNYLLNADEKMLAKLAEIDGVVSVTPRLAFSGLVSLGDATVAFIGEGVSHKGKGRSVPGSTLIREETFRETMLPRCCLGRGWQPTSAPKWAIG